MKRNWHPAGECYFRKTFTLGTPEQGEIQIGCDDRYELYVNGRLVGSGTNWKVLDVYDITAIWSPARTPSPSRPPTTSRARPGWWPAWLVKAARGHARHAFHRRQLEDRR